ncbi:hypothetical protein QJQ45_024102 [Haematococcus lacustris]|nr:hypothetical protein QJQ45_024102 [Haematococcus lacustris]
MAEAVRVPYHACRQEAWQMFDFGYQSYLRHAFPKDNLLPISCSGRNWQGGIGVTLIDSLDTLMVMNRKWDIAHAVELINEQISFDKDAKVHVFEVVIRVLGGLLSGHVLLERQPQPSGRTPYDGSLLRHARDLAMRLLPAFNTSSGLPALFINLRKARMAGRQAGCGLDPSEGSVTCTACAGTLLLELGLLTALTGEPQWRRLAEHAAKAMFDRRSRLGLVGSSVDTGSSTWVSKEATIGPGTDSYFEYLLKAYLMNGDVEQLHAFTDLYTSTMRHQQVPGTLQGFSFLADVHMDSGRLAKPYVSSLGAFWPGMQALIGQEQDAKDLHGNFTAAWRTFGWLPEVFGLDLTKVHPDDAGYNLRPEHVESTYMLHATSGDPHYLKLARRLQKTLVRSSTTRCGYAQIANVETGAQTDLMESFFLAETLKYLYLTFTPGGQHMVEYYLLSTEGHLLPVLHPDGPQAELREQQLLQQLMASPSPSDKEPLAHPSAEGTCSLGLSTAAGVAGPASSTRTGLPANCMDICRVPSPGRQSVIEAQLRSSFPLISFNAEDAAVLRRRRCVACIIVSRRMLSTPRMTQAEVWERVGQLNALSTPPGSSPAPAVLAQVLCVLRVHRSGRLSCTTLRPLTSHDLMHGVPHNAILLQLSTQAAAPPPPEGLLAVAPSSPDAQATQLAEQVVRARQGISMAELQPGRGLLSRSISEASSSTTTTTVGKCGSQGNEVVQHTEDAGSTSNERSDTLSDGHVSLNSEEEEHVAGRDTAAVQATPVEQAATDSSSPCSPSADASCWSTQAKVSSPHDTGVGPDGTRQDAASRLSSLSTAPATGNRQRGRAAHSMHRAESDQEEQQRKQQHQAQQVQPPHQPQLQADHLGPTLVQQSPSAGQGELQGAGLHHAWPNPHSTGPCQFVPLTSGPLMLVEPLTACSAPLANTPLLQGAVAVVLRGQCSFVTKAAAVQAAGARALLVLNVRGSGDVISMSGDDSQESQSIAIPSALLSRSSALLLLHALRRAAELGERPPVASLALPPTPTASSSHTARPHSDAPPSLRSLSRQRRQHAVPRMVEGAGAGEQQQYPEDGVTQPLVELLIPMTSHAFVQASIVGKGLQAGFSDVLQDQRTVLLLWQIAQENEAARQQQQQLLQHHLRQQLQKRP